MEHDCETVPGEAGGDRDASATGARRIALLGNPNTGKTTLFNRLCGVRAKTSNFPGTTQTARVGHTRIGDAVVELIDLPGIYSLELAQSEASVCRDVLAGEAAPSGEEVAPPDAVCVVLDATNLARNLVLAGEVLRRRLPTVVVANMVDLAHARALHIDSDALSDALGCDVVASDARRGIGVDAIRSALGAARVPNRTPPGDVAGLERWADQVYARVASSDSADSSHAHDPLTDRLDSVLTNPVLGLIVFAAVMTGLFWVIFRLATVPMDLLELTFAHAGGFLKGVLPEGLIGDLISDGVVAGVGSTLVFVPQIALLFFLLSLLEDTGYLARAAFLMDRVLRPFGLPGHAFMPLLSSHACALPGIMSARGIPDRRQRLATILVAPFMTCSARIPVYVVLTTMLFYGRPGMAALAFSGCYALGLAAGLMSALIARRTILRGKPRAMVLELPSFKVPSLRTALLSAYDRSMVFVKKAGTVILAISIVLWWLGSFPKVEATQQVADMRARAGAAATPEDTAALVDRADRLEASQAVSRSYAGRMGRAVQPVFAPLGYDWRLSIGVMTSFAAREVFVATMAVVTLGEEGEEMSSETLAERFSQVTRDDGETPVFTAAAAWSLLVYYVLAMQCLPTLAVTAREAGGWRWAGVQFAWMTGVAYGAAFVAYRVALMVGA